LFKTGSLKIRCTCCCFQRRG